MNSNCSFLKITGGGGGGSCGSDTKDRSRPVDCVPLLSCNRDIIANKSAFALSDVENEVDLILSRASIFSTPVNITELVICPARRGALGIGWRRSANGSCRIPVILSRHSDDVLKKPRAERGLSKADSQLVLRESGIFLPVGSGEIETYCFNINIELSSIVVLFLEASNYFSFSIMGCTCQVGLLN